MSQHPIIYARGFAMTEAERNEAAADPFCGFNVGSTVYRASPDKSARADKFVFESPVLRLVTDFDYRDVYQNGSDILDADWAPAPGPDGQPSQGIPPQWMSKSDGVATKKLKYTELQGDAAVRLEIPFDNPKKPGISGRIRLVVRPWSDRDGG